MNEGVVPERRRKTICIMKMYSIFSVLKANKKAAISLLKKDDDRMIVLAAYDDDRCEYVANGMEGSDDCYIRFANDDGEIETKFVVAVRCNKDNKIDICVTDSNYDEIDTDDEKNWFPLSWCDDISEYQVYDAIGNACDVEFVEVK